MTEIAKRQRRHAERQWLKTGLTIFKQVYSAAKRRVTSVVNEAKTAWYSFQISNSDSSRQLFSVYSTLSGLDKSSPLPTNFSEHELPCKFINFFTSKISNIRAELDKLSTSTSTSHYVGHYYVSYSFTAFKPVTKGEIRKIITNSRPTTCSLDPIPTSLLVECIDLLLPIFTNIINESLLSGIFPTTCKNAVVKPLLKKAGLDHKNFKNYRPVSNLSFFSKVIEKVVLKQIYEYLNTNSLLSPNQSAYRPCHSTETALLKVTNDILLALDRGHVSLLALLDLSAAFDTVDHAIMVNTLQSDFGISGTALSWFKSYMFDRKQFVSVNNCCSDPVILSMVSHKALSWGPSFL